MKQLVKSIGNKFGFEINRKRNENQSVAPTRVEDGLGFYETPLGSFYLPLDVLEDIVINHIREGKIFEPEVLDSAKRFIKKGTTVLDVGSNFGQMAVLFSKMVGEDGIVYAFEADDFIFEVLKKNIEANDCKNVIPVFGAVHNISGKEFFFPKQDFKRFGSYGSYGIDINADDGRIVKSIKIDDLEYSKPVSFMKVDVQGSDLFALQGAMQTIQKHRMPILFEFEQQFQEEFKTSFQDYIDFVTSVNYKFIETVINVNYLIKPE